MNKPNKILSILPLIVKKLFRLIIWTIGILFSLYILIKALMFGLFEYKNFKYNKFRKPQSFNSILWKKTFIGPDGKENLFLNNVFDRCYMYKDLVKNYLHLHMTCEEIIRLLGNPREKISYYVNPEIKIIRYSLGACEIRAQHLWYEPRYLGTHLDFYFDREQKLVAVYMSNDKGKKQYLLRDKNISLKKIESNEYLFTCDIKYHNANQCARYIEKIYDYDPLKGTIYNNIEYCNIDEVKAKWGYEAW